ncbi:MAG: hypothetical protein WA435_15060 [Gallionellaceae bacterium]
MPPVRFVSLNKWNRPGGTSGFDPSGLATCNFAARKRMHATGSTRANRPSACLKASSAWQQTTNSYLSICPYLFRGGRRGSIDPGFAKIPNKEFGAQQDYHLSL